MEKVKMREQFTVKCRIMNRKCCVLWIGKRFLLVIFLMLYYFLLKFQWFSFRKKKEILYPPHNSYRVDTGGRLKNLRETCTADRVRSCYVIVTAFFFRKLNVYYWLYLQVRNFHKKFYHLSNMIVIVSGRVNHERLLKIVEATEEVSKAQIILYRYPRLALLMRNVVVRRRWQEQMRVYSAFFFFFF